MRPPEVAGEPVIVIDLRPGEPAARRASRLELELALSQVQGITRVEDAELAAALAGEPTDAQAVKAAEALDRAAAARDQNDCAAARPAAAEAIDGLTAAQAGGDAVGDKLTRAHAIELGCADAAGDHAAAQRAAYRLRRLGAPEPPPGLDAAVWAKYPAIDAAGARELVEVIIEVSPNEAAIWIDHQKAGAGTQTVLLAKGEHLIAAATGRGRVMQRVVVAAEGTKVALAVTERAGRWAGPAATVAAWRAGSSSANALALGQLMGETGVRIAVVMAGTDQLEAWGRARTEQAASRIATGRVRAPFGIGAAIVAQVEAWEGPRVKDEVVRPAVPEDDGKPRQKWWVYLAIVGAVGVGAGLILANDLADDKQRIELRW